jgi:hypothetical protein
MKESFLALSTAEHRILICQVMEKGSFFDKQQECFSDATEEERQSLIHDETIAYD